MSDSTSTRNARPDNLLFHSRIEICRILKLLAQERSPLSAQIKNHHPFPSHLLAVDPEAEHIVVAYSPHKTLNSMVLASPLVEFTATDHQGLHYSFEVATPEEIRFEDQPAIQFMLPKMLMLHNQREHPRIEVPAEISLRCIADAAGIIPFESHITDVSHDGLGCLIFDPGILLDKGAVLKGCRIIMPNGDAIVADLELRYVATITLPDGTLANRGGFRFVQKPPALPKLVGLFIQDLGK